MTPFTPAPAGCRILVHVQPRASRTEVAGLHGEALKVRITAPPVDGAANETLRRFLADALSVPTSAVRIVQGAAGRRKVIEVSGVGPEEARRALI